MPVEITYRCWGCGEEKSEEQLSEDSTHFEMIVWNICPSCIRKAQGTAKESQWHHQIRSLLPARDIDTLS